jgi:hypothetical protein
MHFADGNNISAWRSFSLRDTYTDPLGDLTFEIAPPRSRIDEFHRRLAKGSSVDVRINDLAQGRFLIQTRETSIDREDGVVMRVQCQTPLVTVMQGSVNPDLSLRGQTDVPVSKVILDAFAPYTPPLGDFWAIATDASSHVDAITGKRRDGKKQAIDVETLKHQEAHAQDGESAYRFASRIFTRLGVCLRMHQDGTLLVGSPDYEQAPLYTVHQTFGDPVRGANRAFGKVEIVDTNDDQYSMCTVRGQSGDKRGEKQCARPNASIEAANQFTHRRTYQSTAAPFKPLIVTDKRARDAERCNNSAIQALGRKGKEAFQVNLTVDGVLAFCQDGTFAPWQVDTVCRTIIHAIGHDEPMWILERVFSLSRDGGQSTRLKLIPLGALVLGDE